jgi:hypothetical protein
VFVVVDVEGEDGLFAVYAEAEVFSGLFGLEDGGVARFEGGGEWTAGARVGQDALWLAAGH